MYHVETNLIVREFERPEHAKHFIKLAKDAGIDQYGAEIHKDNEHYDHLRLLEVKGILEQALNTLPQPIKYFIDCERLGTHYTAELEPLDSEYGLLQLIDYNRRADLHKRSTLLHIKSGQCIGVGTKPEIKQLHKIFVVDKWRHVDGIEFASGNGKSTIRSNLKAVCERDYYA